MSKILLRLFLLFLLVVGANAATESENNDFCWFSDSVVLGDTITGTLHQSGGWNQDTVDHFTFNSGSNSGQITITITSDQNIQATLDRYYCGNTQEAQDSGTSITLTANLIANTDYYLTLDALSNGNSSYTIALNTAAPCSNFKVDDDKAQCPDACYSTITDAIDAASANQEILICDGTYNENLMVSKDGLTLKGESGNRANALIQSSSAQPTVTLNGVNGVTLDTLSITNTLRNAVQLDSYTQNSVLKNLALVSSRDTIYTNGNNGRLELYDSVLEAGDDGVDIRGDINGGLALSGVTITSTDRGLTSSANLNGGILITGSGITTGDEGVVFNNSVNNGINISGVNVSAQSEGFSFRGDLNGGTTFSDVAITAGSNGVAIYKKVNSGMSVNGLDVTAQNVGLLFNDELNGAIMLQNMTINADSQAVFFAHNINNDLAISDSVLTSTNNRGIYIGDNAYGAFTLSKIAVMAKNEGLYFPYGKLISPVINDSNITSSNSDGIFTRSTSWTTFTLRDSCVKTENSGKYGLNHSINGTNSHINGNCFYATDTSELARAQRTGNDFLGNYWDDVGGNYTQNNISDTSGLGSCPHGCGGPSPVVLLADWHLDECIWDGNVDEVMDSSGNNYHGRSRHNANTDDDHIINRSALFDGNNYVEIPNFPDLLHNFSIMAWFKTSDRTKQGQRVFADDESNIASQSGYAISVGDGGAGSVRFYDRSQTNNGIIDSDAVVQNNTWYFAAAINDATHNIRHLYVYDASGTLLDHKTRVIDGVRGSNSGMASIGGETDSGETNNRFVGLIDEVKIFESALSQTHLETVLTHDIGGENYDGTVRTASCCCVPENGNLIANPSFEQLCGSSIVQTWNGVSGGTVNMRNNICGWNMNGAGMETWEYTTAEPASDGNVFIEVDGDSGTVDAIWQTLSTVAGECYEVSVDYQARDAASRVNGLKILWNGNEVYSTDSEPETWEKGISVQVMGTGSDEIRFAESASWNDSYGSWIDNVRLGACSSPPVVNFRFDTWDVFRDIHDRNISTKIAAQPFSLTLASLNETNEGYQEFNGTVCSQIVDTLNANTSKSIWVKSSFVDQNSTTVAFSVPYAVQNARVNMVWKKDIDEPCPLSAEDNSSLSSDNFAIRPNNFNISSTNPVYAGENFSLFFQALDAATLPAVDYNESNTNSSFGIDFNETRPECNSGEVLSYNDINFTNGLTPAVDANYSALATFLNIKISENNGSEYAKIDNDDTSDLLRLITPDDINITVLPYEINVTRTEMNASTNVNWLYMADVDDMNLSLHVSVQANNKQHEALKDFNATCYAHDIDLDFNVNVINGDSALDMNYTDIDGTLISIGDTLGDINKSMRISASDFVDGEGNASYALNVERSFDTPVSPFSISGLGATITSIGVAKTVNNDTNLNEGTFAFYYGRVLAKDVKVMQNVTNPIEIEVYKRNDLNASGWKQNSLDWYRNEDHNGTLFGDIHAHSIEDTMKLKGSSDPMVSAVFNLPQNGLLNVDITTTYTHSVNRVFHLDTDPWLWYMPQGFGHAYRYQANSSDCQAHPCFNYSFKSGDGGNEISSGTLSGSSVEEKDRGNYIKKGIKVFR